MKTTRLTELKSQPQMDTDFHGLNDRCPGNA